MQLAKPKPVFKTLRHKDDKRANFAADLAAHVSEGWQIVSSGYSRSEDQYSHSRDWWAILHREAQE